ncbi:four-helix bundle copper-binding protein [Actinoallomurus sp. CA-150999]|uniref:four-helix bundle copper-binding protein n=1 Tax=Actinoallomurus sp. CA-150999 TaxID=3239887 RepID=UPI003D91C7E7
MLPTRELIDSLSVHAALDTETLASVVDALSDCEEVVTACAAGMLGERDLDRMRSSVLHDLDCGDVVVATRRMLTRATGDDSALIAAQLEVCLMACLRSHDSCIRTAAAHEHCRLCAAATERAAEACRRALQALRG